MESNDYVLRADLQEARGEISRHHDLIVWMRNQMEWLIEIAYSPVLDRTDTVRIEAIQKKINREVS